MLYTVSYELCRPGQSSISDTMQVEAVSEKRALEFAQHTLEERYPGEEDYLLLECEVRKPGRPRQFPRREKTSWEMSQELLDEINRRRGSLGRSIYIEQQLRQLWGMPPLKEKSMDRQEQDRQYIASVHDALMAEGKDISLSHVLEYIEHDENKPRDYAIHEVKAVKEQLAAQEYPPTRGGSAERAER